MSSPSSPFYTGERQFRFPRLCEESLRLTWKNHVCRVRIAIGSEVLLQVLGGVEIESLQVFLRNDGLFKPDYSLARKTPPNHLPGKSLLENVVSASDLNVLVGKLRPHGICRGLSDYNALAFTRHGQVSSALFVKASLR